MISNTYRNLYLNLKMRHVAIPMVLSENMTYVNDIPETPLQQGIDIKNMTSKIRANNLAYVSQIGNLSRTLQSVIDIIHDNYIVNIDDSARPFIIEMFNNAPLCDRLISELENLYDYLLSMNISERRMQDIETLKQNKNEETKKYIDFYVSYYNQYPDRTNYEDKGLQKYFQQQLGKYNDISMSDFILMLKDKTYSEYVANNITKYVTNEILQNIINRGTYYNKKDAVKNCKDLLNIIKNNRTVYDELISGIHNDEIRKQFIKISNIYNTSINCDDIPISYVNNLFISKFNQSTSLGNASSVVTALMKYYITNTDTGVANYVGEFVRNTNLNQQIIIIDFANMIGRFDADYSNSNYYDKNKRFIETFANYFIRNCLDNNSVIFCVFKKFKFIQNTFLCELFQQIHILNHSTLTYDEFNRRFVCYGSHMINKDNERLSCTFRNNKHISSGHDDFLFWLLAIIFAKAIVMTSATDIMAKNLLRDKLVLVTQDAQVINRNTNDVNVATKELITDCDSADTSCGIIPVLITLHENFDNDKKNKRNDPIEIYMGETDRKRHREDNAHHSGDSNWMDSYKTKYELKPVPYGRTCVQYYNDNNDFSNDVLTFYNNIKVGGNYTTLKRLPLNSFLVTDYAYNRNQIFTATNNLNIPSHITDIIKLFDRPFDINSSDKFFYWHYLTIQKEHFNNFETAHGDGWIVANIR